MRSTLLLLLIAALGAGALYVLLAPGGRQWLDRIVINATRTEHRWRFRAGEPLRGTPDLARLDERLGRVGVKRGAPVFIRIFKLDSELELWMEKDGRFVKFATYPVCYWSGRLGPKVREGDKQAPEGFYTVAAPQLNPNSRWHLSFNLGFPNAFDQAHGRTGSFLMVHGGCSSIGCYAMTNDQVDEIWNLVKAALDTGQERVPVHVFPFRMSERNLAVRRAHPAASFWADLKTGYDLFEQNRLPPIVSVCEGRYVFEPGRAGTVSSAVEQRCPPAVAGGEDSQTGQKNAISGTPTTSTISESGSPSRQ
jgi:murein L,D-transpeptidase YafK